MSDGLKLKFLVTPSLDMRNGLLELRESHEINGVATQVAREVFNLKEKAIVNGLVSLGWTPPGDSPWIDGPPDETRDGICVIELIGGAFRSGRIIAREKGYITFNGSGVYAENRIVRHAFLPDPTKPKTPPEPPKLTRIKNKTTGELGQGLLDAEYDQWSVIWDEGTAGLINASCVEAIE